MNDDEKQFEDFIRGIKFDDTPDSDHRDKLEQELHSALAKQPRQKQQPLQIWRIIMKNQITKFAAAAAVIIVIMIIGVIELAEPIGSGSVAFAAAMDSVRKARTFSCTVIFEVTYEDGEKREEYFLKQRLMFKEPDRERHEQLTSAPPWPQDVGKVTVWDYGKRQRLQFRPFDKIAEFHDMSSDYDIDDKTGELRLTQLDTNLRDRLLEWSTGAVEDLGSVTLDGQSVRMLQSRKDKRITTVWVNPETNYPVQIEHKWTDQGRSPVLYTSIQIDTKLDDDLFSLEPPEGYILSVEERGWPDDKAKIGAKVKYLGLWCVIYANDNDDQFPSELADIATAGIITNEVLNRVLAAPDDPDGPPVIRYRPPRAGANPSSEVILYEIYDQWPEDGVVAGFADGHCELIVNRNRFEQLIR
jgi:outer membrane lipoprotein-sorting protein